MSASELQHCGDERGKSHVFPAHRREGPSHPPTRLSLLDDTTNRQSSSMIPSRNFDSYSHKLSKSQAAIDSSLKLACVLGITKKPLARSNPACIKKCEQVYLFRHFLASVALS
jgi:hypothetical protein